MVAAALPLTTLFLALALRATALLTSSLTKRIVTKGNSIVDQDRRRVNSIMGRKIFDVTSTPVENANITGYLAIVGVGSPATNCK
jgi:hypothetical protein